MISAVVFDATGVIRSLGDAGISSAILSDYHRATTFRSRHCIGRHVIPHLEEEPDEVLRRLQEIPSTLSESPVLFVGREAELLFVSKHREQLSPHYRLKLPEHSLLETLSDKARFAELAHRLEIPTPQTWHLTSEADLPAIIPEVVFPCVVKPLEQARWLTEDIYKIVGRWQKGALVSNRTALEKLVSQLLPFCPDLLIQEYISGSDETLYDFHAYCSSPGKVDGFFCWRKLRTFPNHFGHVSYAESKSHPEVIRIGMETLEKLNFLGPANVDFKIDDRTGKVVVFEINPRFAFTAHFASRCGVNLPLAYYNDCVGKPLPTLKQTSKERRWLYFYLDFAALRQYRNKGIYTIWSWLRSLLFIRTTFYRWDVRDPGPILAATWTYVSLRFRTAKSKLRGRRPS